MPRRVTESPDNTESPDLIARFLARDRKAIGEIAARYIPRLEQHLKQTVASHGLREADWPDAAQRMFARFLHRPPAGFKQDRPLLPYLRTAIVNEAISMVRKQHAQRFHETAVASNQLRVASGAALSSGSGQKAVDMIESKFAELSDEDRTADS